MMHKTHFLFWLNQDGFTMTLIPHTYEWFEELRRRNPKQAAHTARLIDIAGRDDICSLCGAIDSRLYKTVIEPIMTVRLCPRCRRLQKQMYGLSVDLID
jgi:hypothetical protein